MKIALFKNVKHDYDTIVESETGEFTYYLNDPEYAQLSEVLDIELTMIDVDMNSKKVDLIDADIQKARAGIELLEQAKAELLAIPDLR